MPTREAGVDHAKLRFMCRGRAHVYTKLGGCELGNRLARIDELVPGTTSTARNMAFTSRP